VRTPLAAALALALLALPAPAGEEHLLAGARHFREGRFQEAYVEFSVARRLGEGGEAAWYAAASLLKLGRAEEAVGVFGEAEEQAPQARDTLLDYYRAIACHDARLYLCAGRLLASVEAKGGPKIAGQARKVLADLATVLEAAPGVGALDWYHSRATAALQSGQLALARSYFAEAAELARRRPDRYRLQEAEAGVESTRPARKAGP
jgi:tetratricopeptide (TPR) repeat protein